MGLDRKFTEELRDVLNRNGVDSECETPDFMLTDMLIGYLKSYKECIRSREKWFGRPDPKQPQPIDPVTPEQQRIKELEYLLQQCNQHVIPGEIDTYGGYVIELDAAHKRIKELEAQLKVKDGSK